MISCVICSRRKEQLESVKKNIADTIGVAYEIVAIDNSQNSYSICEAYNLGASQATFDYLCFVHEDLDFKTDNWGQLLVKHFTSLENPGVLGVAGSSYKSLAPSGYWSARTYKSYHYLESAAENAPAELRFQNASTVSRMITLDGVFLAVKNSIWQHTKFDEAIPNFHGYDLDFTMAVSINFHNYFIPDILIHHFSGGTLNEFWIENIFHIHKKWRSMLPLSVDRNRMDNKLEQTILGDFAGLVLSSNLPPSKKNSFIFSSMKILAARQKSIIPYLLVGKAYGSYIYRYFKKVFR